MVGVVTTVCDQPLDRSGEVDEPGRERDVLDVAGRQQKDARASRRVGQGMQLRDSAAAGAADGLSPLPPAAERCARAWVASIAAVSAAGARETKASKIACQTPCWLQRWKRV